MLATLSLTIPLLIGNLLHPTKADGLDLNPALVGCVLSGGSCLANTGIQLIDTLFGDIQNEGHYNTYEYRKFHYNQGTWWSSAGKSQCRKAKQEFFIKKTGWKNNPAQNYDYMKGQYLNEYESRNRGIFDCTDKQREIYIQTMIGKK